MEYLISKDLIFLSNKANEWIKEVSTSINGKGGGKAESAQAQGSNTDKMDEAVELAVNFAKLKLI